MPRWKEGLHWKTGETCRPSELTYFGLMADPNNPLPGSILGQAMVLGVEHLSMDRVSCGFQSPEDGAPRAAAVVKADPC